MEVCRSVQVYGGDMEDGVSILVIVPYLMYSCCYRFDDVVVSVVPVNRVLQEHAYVLFYKRVYTRIPTAMMVELFQY